MFFCICKQRFLNISQIHKNRQKLCNLVFNLGYILIGVIHETKVIHAITPSFFLNFADLSKKMLISAKSGAKQVIFINFPKLHVIVRINTKFEGCFTFHSNIKTEKRDFPIFMTLTEKRLTQQKKPPGDLFLHLFYSK